MLRDIDLSVLRWLFGLSLGTIAALFLTGLSRTRNFERARFSQLLDFFRAIPIIGLVPLIQMHIGVREYGKICLIAWGVMFPVWLTIRAATSRVLSESELMLKGARASRNTIRRILLWPRLLGGIIVGVEIGIGVAWLCVVAAEWIGTYTQGFWSGGLGYRLVVSYENNDWRRLYLALFTFGLLGIGSSYAWKLFVKLAVARTDGFDPARWLKRG